MKKNVLLLSCILLVVVAPLDAGKAKEKKNSKDSAKYVDSGSFGVYMNGARVVTENFTIVQKTGGSVATSEVRSGNGGEVLQTSELMLSAGGDLQKYEWREVQDKSRIVVEPQDQFLIGRFFVGEPQTQQDVPFLLPTSTVILDDNFFVHRQILLWRYLSYCGGSQIAGNGNGCELKPEQFGVLVPQKHTPERTTLSYAGKEKIAVRGKEMELDRFVLKTDDSEWSMWLDSQYKLMRVTMAGTNVEVLRD